MSEESNSSALRELFSKLNEPLKEVYTSSTERVNQAIDWIREDPMRTTIFALDTFAAGLFIGRVMYGLSAEPEDRLANTLFANELPHFIYGFAPLITIYYYATRRSVDRGLATFYGVASTTPVFIRELIQAAHDSVTDSIWTAAGVITGVAVSYLIIDKYNKKLDLNNTEHITEIKQT